VVHPLVTHLPLYACAVDVSRVAQQRQRIVAGHTGLYLAYLLIMDVQAGAAGEQQQGKCGKDEAHDVAGSSDGVLKTYVLCEENASANFFAGGLDISARIVYYTIERGRILT